MLARVEQERLESLKYDKATIYIKCIDEAEDAKSENNSEVSRHFTLHTLSEAAGFGVTWTAIKKKIG